MAMIPSAIYSRSKLLDYLFAEGIIRKSYLPRRVQIFSGKRTKAAGFPLEPELEI
ncbi:MAG: hypothetical protein HDT14_13470 [Oscillibacter sp.]|nr:hypothetical protein [Oscillibacter sp.]